MTVFPKLMIFKHLFNSLELSTNWNGVDRKGSSLDREVAGTSGIPMTNAEKWRRFYDRTKHVDRTAKDATEFVGGLATISDDLVPLRSYDICDLGQVAPPVGKECRGLTPLDRATNSPIIGLLRPAHTSLAV